MMVKLLSTGWPCGPCAVMVPGDRRRVWVSPGVPVVIGPRLVMTLQLEREQGSDEHELRMQVQGSGVEFSAPVPADCWVDLSQWADLLAVPRAVEQPADGSAGRVLVEFVKTGRGVAWAL